MRAASAGTLFNNWGVALAQMGQPLKAEELYRRAIQISSSGGAKQNVSPMLLYNYARTLGMLDRDAESVRYAERAYADARRAGDEVVVNMALLARTAAYRRLGDFVSARKTLAEVEPRLAKMLPPGHSAFGALASERALLAQAQGDFPAALAEINREMAIVEGNNQNAFAAPLVLTRRSERIRRRNAAG